MLTYGITGGVNNVQNLYLENVMENDMKILVSDNEGYEVYLEVSTPSYGKTGVIFYTKYKNAKNPDLYQKKFEMYLTPDELSKFRVSI